MIKLKLEPYCAHCIAFEPYADRPQKYWVKDSEGKETVEKYTRDTIWVRCKYAVACDEILRRQIKYGKI